MSTPASSSWPYSAATTHVLARLREDGPPQITRENLAKIAVKELVLRGQLRVLEVRRKRGRWSRGTEVIVATAGPVTPGALPVPLTLLARALPATSGRELSGLIREAGRADSKLFNGALQEAIEEKLIRDGVAERRKKRILGVFPQKYVAPTASGQSWVTAAEERDELARDLAFRVDRDPSDAAKVALGLGALVLLAPTGLGAMSRISQWWQSGGAAQVGATSVDWDVDFGDFNVLDAMSGALSAAVDGLGEALGSIDAAFDSISDSIDSGIDSGVSDGGGGGDSGGDGGGCGGGGD